MDIYDALDHLHAVDTSMHPSAGAVRLDVANQLAADGVNVADVLEAVEASPPGYYSPTVVGLLVVDLAMAGAALDAAPDDVEDQDDANVIEPDPAPVTDYGTDDDTTEGDDA